MDFKTEGMPKDWSVVGWVWGSTYMASGSNLDRVAGCCFVLATMSVASLGEIDTVVEF